MLRVRKRGKGEGGGERVNVGEKGKGGKRVRTKGGNREGLRVGKRCKS